MNRKTIWEMKMRRIIFTAWEETTIMNWKKILFDTASIAV
jgi:hypothetical protein